jgi:hypothetical protein
LGILVSDLRKQFSISITIFKTIGVRKMALTGSSSAVGGASMNDCRIGRLKFVDAQRVKRFKSVLDIPPIWVNVGAGTVLLC